MVLRIEVEELVADVANQQLNEQAAVHVEDASRDETQILAAVSLAWATLRSSRSDITNAQSGYEQEGAGVEIVTWRSRVKMGRIHGIEGPKAT